MMFKKISFYLFILLFPSIIISNQIPNREMIILLETLDAENINLTLNSPKNYQIKEGLKPTGLGAISITMLIALYEQAAPIIANKSLIKNIIDHQNLFADFINLNRETLYNKYSKYNRFKDRETIDNFKNHYQYINRSFNEINKELGLSIKNANENHIQQVLNKISSDKRFDIKSYPSELPRLQESNNFSVKMLYLESTLYILCSLINFNDWQIKQVNEDIFLLLPKNYIKSLNFIIPEKNEIATHQKFTPLEFKLGLKVDHMKDCDRNFFEQPTYFNNQYIYFTKSLEQIFITKNDIKKSSLKITPEHIWSIYMTGHGLSKCIQIDILPQLKKLKHLLEKKLSKHKFKKCIVYEKNKHINNPEQLLSCKKYINNINRINQEIEKAKEVQTSSNKEYLGVIASLSIEEFRDVLKFLNNNIQTCLLYYTSCFGGGINLLEPYMEDGTPLILGFPIISGTPSENMSVQECPFLNLPPYTKENKPKTFTQTFDLKIKDIDIANKKLKLVTTLQFDNFFSALRNGCHKEAETISLLPYHLHPHVDTTGKIVPKFIPNFPVIRFANTDHFKPIPNDKSSMIIDKTNDSKPIIINKYATLIYSEYIPGKITLNKLNEQEIPEIFSMLPGFVLHVFEEISSSTLSLQDVVNSFLTFRELGSSKIFWIKKLECTKDITNQNNEILKDVIILRNIFNSDTLNNSPDRESLSLENCTYFSTQSNIESKLTWNGPFIEDKNYQINLCNKGNHKEECLNCFPNLASFLSPVLQSL